MFDWNFFGSFLIHLAVVMAFFAALTSVAGMVKKDGRLLIAGERAGYATTAILMCISFTGPCVYRPRLQQSIRSEILG